MISKHSLSSHKKSVSLYDSKELFIVHRRGLSAAKPASSQEQLATRFPSLSLKTEPRLQSSGFMKVLNSSLRYFSQKPRLSKYAFSSSNPQVQILEQEKVKLKLETSSLLLALARAKAGILLYKGRVKSLKSYCKLMEANNYSNLSKQPLQEDSICSVEIKNEVLSSSETEFKRSFN